MHQDAYWTPPHLLLPLLDREQFPEPVWEPAAGAGWIARELAALGHDHVASDFHSYGYPVRHCDFLRDRPRWSFNSILTNGPFRKDADRLGARDWFRRACAYRPRKLALMMVLGPGFADCFDTSLVGEMRLKRVIVFDRKVCRFGTPTGRPAASPFPVGWFVLAPGWRQKPDVDWVRGPRPPG